MGWTYGGSVRRLGRALAVQAFEGTHDLGMFGARAGHYDPLAEKISPKEGDCTTDREQALSCNFNHRP